MLEFIQQYLALFILLAPLGLIGLWRWSIYLFKVHQSRRYTPVPENDAFSSRQVSFVVPVYNEDPDAFRHALSTWIAEAPGVIVLVIDHSDTTCAAIAEEVNQEQSDVPLDIVITTRKGKREALVDGVRRVNTEFVALIDSDTFFAPNVLPPLLAPFVDSRIGGTAPRQRVYNPQSTVERVYDIQLDERYDVEMPFMDVGGLTTTCISGRTAMYRTAAINTRLDELEFEYFLGTRCVSGDDKCLTRVIQRNDWLVKYQSTALVYTHAASDIGTYLKQRIRWTRNTWRSDMIALFREGGWAYRNRYLALHMLDRFVQPFTLILGPIFFFGMLFLGFYTTAVFFLFWIFFTRLLKLHSHLARNPRSILIVPHYIVLTYVIAILKIYALFTIWKQGWITRWNKNRLTAGVWNILYGRIVPWGATIATILLLAQGVNLFYDTALAAAMNNSDYRSRVVTQEQSRQEARALEEAIRNPDGTRPHLVTPGEDLQSIAQHYNVLPSVIEIPTEFAVGETVQIPIAELRTPNSVEDLSTRERSQVSYVPFSSNEPSWKLEQVATENIVRIRGAGTAISIREVIEQLQTNFGASLVTETEPGVWHMRASISVEDGATLYFPGEEVQWLRLHSAPDYFAWMASFDASMLIENTRISSWDPNQDQFDTAIEDTGRSFVLAKDSGRLDIINSELSHLGYVRYADRPRGYPFGGSYGLSWKLEAGTLEESILTGNIVDSSVSNNMFGIYTYGSVAQIMRGNDVYENIEYGFDPHDDSNHLIIEDNRAYDNGNHGIITSKRCFNNIFANNVSVNNELHGIMLDQASDRNVVYGNRLSGNEDGIVALDSHDNYIFDNEMRNNRNAAIRFNVMSSGNISFDNDLRGNYKGVYVYEGAIDNHFLTNIIVENDIGIHLLDARFNTFVNNVLDDNDSSVKLHERSVQNYVNNQ